MLRTDRKAGFVAEGAWFWRRYRFQATRVAARSVSWSSFSASSRSG
jgi:hypothetical protein